MKKQYLDSGKIVGTHGIKGEVRIEPWCDSPAFLSAFKKLYLDENGTSFIEVKSRPHKNITLAKIKGVDAIEDAERYRGKIVYITAMISVWTRACILCRTCSGWRSATRTTAPSTAR
ncbi:MAG: hypothetical protein U0P28_05970 [Ruminococcus sp.]